MKTTKKKPGFLPTTRQFLVTLDIPPGCTVAEIREYIKDAVGTWHKGGDPVEPLFRLDDDSVKVKSIKKQA